MTGNLAAAGRKRHTGNCRCLEADEIWELELCRGEEIGEPGWGVASNRIDIVRHAKKNLVQ